MKYFGSFEHAVDPKGRVVVPASFREAFRDGGHLSLRRDHLALYDPASWNEYVEKLRERRLSGGLSRDQFNQVMAISPLVAPDAQGRFSLPPRLRESARIGANVVFVGADDYLGIYAPETAPVPTGVAFDSLMDALEDLSL